MDTKTFIIAWVIADLFIMICVFIWLHRYAVLYYLKRIPRLPKYLKRLIWNRGIKIQLYKNYIPKDEFHKSLNIDIEAMLDMNQKQQDKYITNLMKRRDIAHERDLEEEDKQYGF